MLAADVLHEGTNTAVTSERTGDRSTCTGTTGATGADVTEHFRAVLDTEKRWLSAAGHSDDFAHWRNRVVREVMDRQSPYAQALRRGHGADQQNEFIQSWQALIAAALERIPAGCGTGASPAAVPGRVDKVATAILAALHGGATLSWLAQDAQSLEAALDIALAPVLLHPEPEDPDDRRPD